MAVDVSSADVLYTAPNRLNSSTSPADIKNTGPSEGLMVGWLLIYSLTSKPAKTLVGGQVAAVKNMIDSFKTDTNQA